MVCGFARAIQPPAWVKSQDKPAAGTNAAPTGSPGGPGWVDGSAPPASSLKSSQKFVRTHTHPLLVHSATAAPTCPCLCNEDLPTTACAPVGENSGCPLSRPVALFVSTFSYCAVSVLDSVAHLRLTRAIGEPCATFLPMESGVRLCSLRRNLTLTLTQP